MSKRPSFQFYPTDWRTDPSLRLCSAAARGFWIDLMCVMHECEPYGHLVRNGREIDANSIGKLIGESKKDVKKWLAELEENEVFSRTDQGIIYSRRMVRDETVRDRRAEAGKTNGFKGAEFGKRGAEHGKKGGRPRTNKGDENGGNSEDQNPGKKPPQEPGQNPHPSSSSSSSNTFPNGNDAGSTSPEGQVDPLKAVWDEAKEYLGANRSGLIGKWVKAHGPDAFARALKAAKAENDGAGAADPPAFIQACLNADTRRAAEEADAKAAADAAFFRRYPKQNLSVSDARALMTDEEFERWCARNGIDQGAAA